MTETSRDAQVTAWHLELTRKLEALRTRWAAEAEERAARPPEIRRNTASPRRRHTAGPADAARQARQAREALRLREAREAWLLSMERTAMDIVMITAD
jgi:hypothetical protein